MEFTRYLQKINKKDLEENFQNEWIHLQAHLKNINNMSILQLCKWLKENYLYEIYANVYHQSYFCLYAYNELFDRTFFFLFKTNENIR